MVAEKVSTKIVDYPGTFRMLIITYYDLGHTNSHLGYYLIWLVCQLRSRYCHIHICQTTDCNHLDSSTHTHYISTHKHSTDMNYCSVNTYLYLMCQALSFVYEILVFDSGFRSYSVFWLLDLVSFFLFANHLTLCLFCDYELVSCFGLFASFEHKAFHMQLQPSLHLTTLLNTFHY